MGSREPAFAIVGGRLVHDEIDGEILAIDNETGTYLSMRGLGAACWTALVHGATRDALLAEVADACAVDTAQVEPLLDAFVAKLDELGLLRTIEPGEAVPPEISSTATPGIPTDLAVDVYTDLQDLLLFDPIHEVEDSGWPNQRS